MRRFVIIVIVSIAVVSATFIFNRITFVPRFKSTATLYILRHNEKQSDYAEREDFSLALKVINDCSFLIKSRAVLDEVICDLELDTSYDQLASDITTNNPANTRVLEVTVEAESPELAKRIADTVCMISADKIESAMGFAQVNYYEGGTIEKTPFNKIGVTTYAVMAVIVAAILYLVFFVIYVADDRVRTDEDITDVLGLSILGDIPNAYGVGRRKA